MQSINNSDFDFIDFKGEETHLIRKSKKHKGQVFEHHVVYNREDSIELAFKILSHFGETK